MAAAAMGCWRGRPALGSRTQAGVAIMLLLGLCATMGAAKPAGPGDASSAALGSVDGGRRLQQDGANGKGQPDSGNCIGEYYIINNCNSKKPVWVTIGTYTIPKDPPYSGELPGWETIGWKKIVYGGTPFKTTAATYPPNFIFNYIKNATQADALPRSAVNPRAFCIARDVKVGKSFRILVGSNKTYFRYKVPGSWKNCAGANGHWVDTAVMPNCAMKGRPSGLPGLVFDALPPQGRFITLTAC